MMRRGGFSHVLALSCLLSSVLAATGCRGKMAVPGSEETAVTPTFPARVGDSALQAESTPGVSAESIEKTVESALASDPEARRSFLNALSQGAGSDAGKRALALGIAKIFEKMDRADEAGATKLAERLAQLQDAEARITALTLALADLKASSASALGASAEEVNRLKAQFLAEQSAAVSLLKEAMGLTFNASPLAQLELIVEFEEDAKLPIGVVRQIGAVAIYGDQSKRDVSSLVGWSSSAPGVAAFHGSDGLASKLTALAVGTTEIKAALGAVEAKRKIDVGDAALRTLKFTQASGEVVVGGEGIELKVRGSFSDGVERDVTASVEWASANESVADAAPGYGLPSTILGRGRAPGETKLIATFRSTAAQFRLKVLPPERRSMHIAGPGLRLGALTRYPACAAPPDSGSAAEAEGGDGKIFVGAQGNYTAYGYYSDCQLRPLTGNLTWSALPAEAVRFVTNEKGIGVDGRMRMEFLKAGETQLAVKMGSTTAESAKFQVHQPVTVAYLINGQGDLSLLPESCPRVLPSAPPPGESFTFRVTAIADDCGVTDVSQEATYISSDKETASFGQGAAAKVLRFLKVGSVSVSATIRGRTLVYGSVTGGPALAGLHFAFPFLSTPFTIPPWCGLFPIAPPQKFPVEVPLTVRAFRSESCQLEVLSPEDVEFEVIQGDASITPSPEGGAPIIRFNATGEIKVRARYRGLETTGSAYFDGSSP